MTEGRSAEIGVIFDGDVNIQRAVDIVLRDGTATEADGDYRPSARTVSVPTEGTGRYFAYGAVDDDIPESPESFFIELVNPSPGLAVTVGTTEVVIIDND